MIETVITFLFTGLLSGLVVIVWWAVRRFIDKVSTGFDNINAKFDTLISKISAVEAKNNVHNERFLRYDNQIENIDKRVYILEKRDIYK